MYESFRSRRKESTRREDVESRLADLQQSEKSVRKAFVALEKELLQQKAKNEPLSSTARILPREIWEVEQKRGGRRSRRGVGCHAWALGRRLSGRRGWPRFPRHQEVMGMHQRQRLILSQIRRLQSPRIRIIILLSRDGRELFYICICFTIDFCLWLFFVV